MQKAIEVKHLFFRYDREYVLENINLVVYEKEYIAIIGPNGGGKTTFIKLLLGLLHPTKGEIRIFGKPPTTLNSVIGYMPQQTSFGLDIPLRVEDVVLQGRLERGKLFFDRKDKKIAQEVLERVGLWDLRKKRIAQLSGGQRQKALLARALAAKPKIVILDEPTASIDPQGQKEIYEILQNLDLTRIVVSHDINILFTGVDRIAYINRKLYIHENPKIDIHPNKEHFCQIDLFQELARSCGNG